MKRQSKSMETSCSACEWPTNERLNYFKEQFLAERDFRDEQLYHMGRRRQHNRFLHGVGTVCGLKVVPHEREECQDRFVKIMPGLAIDPCGREIWVPQEVYVDLEKHLAQHPRDEKGQLPPGRLLVSLCYRECGTELVPVLFSECGCDGTRCEPNRIQESYEVSVELKKPDWQGEIDEDYKVEDCNALYDRVLDPCAEMEASACVLLAVIKDFTLGKPVHSRMIDNSTLRSVLPSTHLLDQMIRCILAKKELTKIVNINWDNAHNFSDWDLFKKLYVEDEKSPKSFKVEFSEPVELTEKIEDEIAPHIFQAVVVRNIADTSSGHAFEVVPARAWQSADKRELHLQINPRYAEEHLATAGSFDLYLTVRCNLIVNKRGVAVDGNLMARPHTERTYEGIPPTGDGVPGGTFEGWIRFRPYRRTL